MGETMSLFLKSSTEEVTAHALLSGAASQEEKAEREKDDTRKKKDRETDR